MTLICELNQYVVHIYEGLAAMPCSGGYLRNWRGNPDFWAFLADSWGKIFSDPRISSMLKIVYNDRNCLKTDLLTKGFSTHLMQ